MGMEVYKGECREIIRRFMARRLTFDQATDALAGALVEARPKLSPTEVLSLRDFISSNNGILARAMYRREKDQEKRGYAIDALLGRCQGVRARSKAVHL